MGWQQFLFPSSSGDGLHASARGPGISLERPSRSRRSRSSSHDVISVSSQFRFGAKAITPTGFLTVNMPLLRQRMMSFADLSHSRPSPCIGLAPDDQFKTASFKCYPPKLCKAVVFSLCRSLPGSPSTVNITEEQVSWVEDARAAGAQACTEAQP